MNLDDDEPIDWTPRRPSRSTRELMATIERQRQEYKRMVTLARTCLACEAEITIAASGPRLCATCLADLIGTKQRIDQIVQEAELRFIDMLCQMEAATAHASDEDRERYDRVVFAMNDSRISKAEFDQRVRKMRAMPAWSGVVKLYDQKLQTDGAAIQYHRIEEQAERVREEIDTLPL